MAWIPNHLVYNVNVEDKFDRSDREFTSATNATNVTSMIIEVLISILAGLILIGFEFDEILIIDNDLPIAAIERSGSFPKIYLLLPPPMLLFHQPIHMANMRDTSFPKGFQRGSVEG